jgi:hypothetical protein
VSRSCHQLHGIGFKSTSCIGRGLNPSWICRVADPDAHANDLSLALVPDPSVSFYPRAGDGRLALVSPAMLRRRSTRAVRKIESFKTLREVGAPPHSVCHVSSSPLQTLSTMLHLSRADEDPIYESSNGELPSHFPLN